MLFSEACERFYLYQQVIGNQVATVKAYKSHLKQFELFCCNCDVSELDYQLYCDYVISLLNKKISSVTIYDYTKDLKILLKFLYKNGLLAKDIAYQIEKLPKRKKIIPKVIPVDTIRLILRTAKRNDVLHTRNCLIILLCYDCGLRLSELIRLQLNDFDLQNNVIRVTGKGNKQRNVPLTSIVLKYYKKYLRMTCYRNCGQLLLSANGRIITVDCITTLFKRLKKKYKLEDFHPHLLRHSFATLFLLNGGDALILQEILGHTTLEMTKNYVHIANSLNIACNRCYSPFSCNSVINAKTFSDVSHAKHRKGLRG